MRAEQISELRFTAPIQIISEANNRDHWRERRRRQITQKQEVWIAMHQALKSRRISLPCTVKLTRIGMRALDPDNLANAFKAIQDAIAQKLGVDDGDTAKVTWTYHQRPTGKQGHALEVDITTKETET